MLILGNSKTRYPLLILAASALVLFVALGTTRFWDRDEGFFAGAAAEMYARGDGVVPYFNDDMFGHKPPWMYWMMMTGYHLFGVNEWGARFFSAVFGVAAAWLTYRLGLRLLNRRAGFFAGLAMTSCVMFTVVARAATPDSYLVFFSMLSLYIFAMHGFAREHGEDRREASSTNANLPRRWRSFALMYAVMGLGVLVKGPIGVLFPMAVIGMFLLCTTPRRAVPAESSRWVRMREACRPFGPVNFFRTVWQMRPLTAAAMVLLVAGPWYLAVGLQTNGTFLWEFFVVHHFHRFGSAMDGHHGMFFYYLPVTLVGMFPWSVFAVPALLVWVRGLRERGRHAPALLFLTCWAGVYIGLFSLAGTKLPNYVLPAYPALAVMVGYFLDRWLSVPQQVHRGWLRVALSVLPAVGLTIAVLFPAAGLIRFGGETLWDRFHLAREVQLDLIGLGLVGLPPLVGGATAWILAERQRIDRAVATVCVTAVLSMACLWWYAAPRLDRFQAPQDMAQWIQRKADSGPCRVAHYCFFRPTMVFYADHHVEAFRTLEQVRVFLLSDEPGYLVTNDVGLRRIQAILPPDVQVLQRRSRFPEKGEILLLSRRVEPAATDRIADGESPPLR